MLTCTGAQQDDLFEAIAYLIGEAQSIVICAHTNPDGDALGSQLALKLLIEQRWPRKEVTCLLADDEPCPRIYSFLAGSEDLIPATSYTGTPDLFICVDLSIPRRLKHAEEALRRAKMVAVIDHHPCEKPYGDATLIRPSAAAAGILVAEFAEYLGEKITPPMAQCLFCAIATDTGRFQYQNADAEAFEVASRLVACGANPSDVSLNVYQSFRLQFLHLKSVVMGRITTFERGRIAYSYATVADIERTGASLDESDGLVDVVRSVAGSEIALFIKEVKPGKVRGNLRAKGSRDISKVARALGGGGHRAASGFSYKGSVDDALCAALPLLKDLLKEEEEEDARRRDAQ
ncbi:MAG: bifunctional oligoribonuclease/PAP phosphatase NrnA [Atopobiaceae bacterium]|nr:bifunctional oligoribonuclease/PAP phosphatase NrnA [Atopobiaceae bacterium]